MGGSINLASSSRAPLLTVVAPNSAPRVRYLKAKVAERRAGQIQKLLKSPFVFRKSNMSKYSVRPRIALSNLECIFRFKIRFKNALFCQQLSVLLSPLFSEFGWLVVRSENSKWMTQNGIRSPAQQRCAWPPSCSFSIHRHSPVLAFWIQNRLNIVERSPCREAIVLSFGWKSIVKRLRKTVKRWKESKTI